MAFDYNRLKAERIAKDMTLAEMAKLIGMSESGYSLIESGKRSLTIERFAEILEKLSIPESSISIFFKK